jgi:hypothetical protein
MEKEFIPYEQALALKELGFNGPCFFNYYKTVKGKLVQSTQNNYSFRAGVPLYQQAFRWFREKYEIDSWVFKNLNLKYSVSIIKNEKAIGNLSQYDTPEEAELACLINLIEIIKK